MTAETHDERGDGPEQAIEHDADELEHRLERLGDDIDDAEKKLADRREDAGAGAGEDVAGDWEDESAGAGGGGEDPSGAVDAGEADER